MPKKKEENTIRQFLFKNLLWFIGLAWAIVNLYLASKLTPVVESVRVLGADVRAVEGRVDLHDKAIEGMGEKLDKIIWEIGNLKQYCH